MYFKSWISILISFFSLCGNGSARAEQTSYSLKSPYKIVLTGPAQGTSYHITYFDRQETISKNEIDSILQVIDQSMSIYNPLSTISQFNQLREGTVKLDSHFQKVIQASFEYNRITEGIFDITVAPLIQLWGFGPKKVNHFPDSNEISTTLRSVGMDKLIWKVPYLQKSKPMVSIDVNGIAQGYSVDVLADFLESKHIKNYIVELGGEMRVKGKNLQDDFFKIGIERPSARHDQQLKTEVVRIKSGALTTAGNFEKFMMRGNQKITHHVNPLTGYMFASPIISVTVYAKTAMEADALDNYFMALTPDQVINFVERRKNLEVYIIFKNENGEIEEKFSTGFSTFFLK
ncbi:FAD:protein FMN transferase [Sphingobacterium sp. SRCM116780]|uniref:FAD:protein FMN transferase n=1 Tax=Sphingobacterium sp. SRCM116780 TaxID=2907623 RepID=UPI001F2AE6D0|nr:FAD:protein FMN transferase [Sphingobacterium sp. SRCM116780]UIR56883.1 FAD:protein FMN transferase [Sphingobacterium sp. SRCM116780]